MSSFSIALLVAACCYWIFCLVVGAFTFKKVATPAEYFVAGRRLGPFVLALAMLATVQSAWMMLGHQGLAYRAGIPYVTYYAHLMLMSMVALLFFGHQWLLGKRYGFITPPEMFGKYYESELTRILMVILGVIYVIPYVSIQLLGGGTIFATLSKGEISFSAGMIVMTAVVVIYVFLGGIRAAAITDTLQGILLVLGIFVLGGVVLAHVPGGWSGLLSGIKTLPSDWRLLPGTGNAWPWQFVLTFAIAPVGIYLSPIYTVWAFTARTPRIFRWQMVVVMGLVAGFYYYILSPIIGGGGRLLFPALAKPDALTPTIMVELMPAWLAILVAIAVFAAMNSTADAYLAVISGILSRDIYLRYINPRATGSQQVWFGRFMVIAVVVVGLFFATKTKDFISLIGGLATAFGLQTLPALVGMIYWRRLTAAGINAGLIAGIITVFLTYSVWQYPLKIHCSVWGLLANFVVAVVVSMFTKPVSEQTRKEFAAVLAEGQKVYRRRLAEGTLRTLRLW